mmetsp:Transcript_68996/g.174322  ORF Transcript_68996/g.174322 Transcript_68996/m.174322 type:complete len:564 (-) Transcript_68996:21-1712(-)
MPGGMPGGMPPMPGGMPGGPPGMPGGLPGGLPGGPFGDNAPPGLGGGCGGGGGGGGLPPMPPLGGSGGGMPSMEELGKNADKFCSGKTISDQEVKVQDPSGRPMSEYPRYSSFDQAPFPSIIQDALRKAGFPAPSQIQQYCWPLAMQGRDVIGVAATGSGKTISFLLPAFASILEQRLSSSTPALCVIAPTRELAIQIQEEADKFGKPDIRTVCCYGGAPKGPQADEIRRGVHGIIGTPGRINDFIEGNQLDLGRVCKLVLDEADRMLDMGFEPQIRDIVESHGMAPKDGRQTMMFSATFPEKCQRLAADYLYDYVWIAVGVIGSAVETVEQVLERVDPAKKYEKLIEVLDAWYASRQPTDRLLIFTNAKATAKWLDEQLYEKKFDSGALYGDLTQQERETNLHRFRQGEIDVLIATDVASRGLDIEGVSVVVNYDMPTEIDCYIHRIGRTGRIGNEGKAISFLSTDDSNCSLESVGILKELVGVMTNSGKDLPDWLEGLIESTENNSSWSWGGKDVRPDQEQYKGSGSGDAWGQWNKSDTNGDDSAWKEDAWQKEDPWAKKW